MDDRFSRFIPCYWVVRIAIIAHLLSPYNLGVFGVVTIVLGFLEIITETGINVVLIQEKENMDAYINNAWVVSIARGAVISVLMFISAPFIGHFFNSSGSTQLLYIAGVTFLLSADL